MNRVLVVLVALVVVLLLVGAGLLIGVDPFPLGPDSERPPCHQLPDRQTVADAVASHQELVTRIQKAGTGVTVEVTTPCDDQPNRAIVTVTYTMDDEWEGVDAILTHEGFGVPVELVSD